MSRFMSARMRDDSGIAMVVVIGVMSVVTVLAVGSFVLASQALHESGRIEDSSRAFRTASSGLELTVSTLTEDKIPELLENGTSGSTPDGTYELELNELGRGQYELVSRGQGLDDQVETVRQRFFFMNLWKMNIASDTEEVGSGSALNGNSHIIGPFYATSHIDMGGAMSILEGPLFVKSDLDDKGINKGSGASNLGTSDEPIDLYVNTLVVKHQNNDSRVHIAGLYSAVPDIMLPPLTLEMLKDWAQVAIDESVDNEMGSTEVPNSEALNWDPATYETMYGRTKASATGDINDHYKFFSAKDRSMTPSLGGGTTRLTIHDESFGAWGAVTDVDGVSITTASDPSYDPPGAHDDFAYDADRRILYISGTVFVDGPVTFGHDNSAAITYVGNGTIVANGDITVNGSLRPYGSSPGSTTDWTANNEQARKNKWALGLVTPGKISFGRNDNSAVGTPGNAGIRDTHRPSAAGAFYAGESVSFTQHSLVQGSVLTRRMDFGATLCTLVTNPLLPTYLPDSLPGGLGGYISMTHWSRD